MAVTRNITKCICGAELKLTEAQKCYDHCKSIECDKCETEVLGSNKVYHCNKTSAEHKDGYDLCISCAIPTQDRKELIIYGYFRNIFNKDIPNDIYTLCCLYNRPIMQLLMYIQNNTVRFHGFGIFNSETNLCTKFDCTSLKPQLFTPLCHIPNITSYLQQNEYITRNKQLNGILVFEGALRINQTGNNRLGSTTYNKYPILLLYDPQKIYNYNEIQTFDHVIKAKNKATFEFGPSLNPIFCGNYGIIYESTFNLYQLKLQSIKGNNIKFNKMKTKNKLRITFPDSNKGHKYRHSLSLLYLNGKDKIFAVRNHFSARDARRRVIRNPQIISFKSPCGIYDLKTNEWIKCGYFGWDEMDSQTRGSYFRSSSCYDEQKNVIYVFGFVKNEIWISIYNLNKNEWYNLGKQSEFFGFHGHFFKIDKFERVLRCWYFGSEIGLNSIRSKYCKLGKEKLVWKDSKTPKDRINQENDAGCKYSFFA